MEAFSIIFPLLLLRNVVSLICPSEYLNKCDCENNIITTDYILRCPSIFTNSSQKETNYEKKYFEMHFIPRRHVLIQCYNSPNWSNFVYNISSSIQRSKLLILTNCTLLGNDSLIRIAKLIGAQNSAKFLLKGNFDNEIIISKKTFEGFSKLKVLHFDSNWNLTFLNQPSLTNLLELNEVIFMYNRMRKIPETFSYNMSELRSLTLNEELIESLEMKTFQNMPKLNYLNLNFNHLKELEPHTFDDLNQLKTLSLGWNKLNTPPSDIFVKLTNLETIFLYGNNFKSLPEDLFKENEKLVKINLGSNDLETIPSGLFRNSSNLLKICLNKNKLSNLPRNLFNQLYTLKHLDLSDNMLTGLPEKIFNDLDDLNELYLHNNRLTTISSNLLAELRDLEYFKADHNQIKTIHRGAFQNLLELRDINLSHNKIRTAQKGTDVSSNNKISIFSLNSKLEKLDLSHNEILDIYNDWTLFLNHLKLLDLSHNNITELSGHALYVNHLADFTINLCDNKIRTINLKNFEMYFDAYSTGRNIFVKVHNNPIVCDIRIYDLLRYLDGSMSNKITNSLHISVEDLKCTGPEEYNGTLLTNLVTKTFRASVGDTKMQGECPTLCNHQVIPFEKTVVIDCANRNLTEAPKMNCHVDGFDDIELNLRNNSLTSIPNLDQEGYRSVKRLLLSGNSITNISTDALTPKLKVLELDNNNMTKLTPEVINKLKHSSLENISLSGNPWTCDCEDRDFFALIQNPENKFVSDSWKVTCQNLNKVLKLVTVNELCFAQKLNESCII